MRTQRGACSLSASVLSTARASRSAQRAEDRHPAGDGTDARVVPALGTSAPVAGTYPGYLLLPLGEMDDRFPFIATEFVEGPPLDALLKPDRSTRLRHAPEKEDDAALAIANEEQEGPVGAELGDERPCFLSGLLRHHDDGRGGGRFGTLFVDLDESLVQHLRDKELVVGIA